MPPPWFLYAFIVVCLYLAIVEPILERVFKKEIVLEHFWMIPVSTMIGERLTRKELKRFVIFEYLLCGLGAAYAIYLSGESGGGHVQYEFQIPGWYMYFPALLFSYLGVVEPILERVLKKELMLTHFWILPTNVLTGAQLKRCLIVAYLGALFVLLAMSGLLGF